jgi:tRNA dimethylallyltransferase
MNSEALVVVVGPTASGKSSLAMRIAQQYDGEIIAADSRTVYRGMDIGTAKPTASDQRQVRHHLLDILNPGESFSAAEFKKLALEAITDIQHRGKLPVLVGGTGLYIDAVIFDYQFGPAVDETRRKDLNAKTVEQLQDICRQNNINIPTNSQNKRHLVRAIEMGGLIDHKKRLRDNTLVVGIATERDTLRARIATRVRKMVSCGVVNEIAQIGKTYGWGSEALKADIYRTFKGVAEGTKLLEEAMEECIQSDVSLAKRQMTWLKRNPYIVWSMDSDVLIERVDTFLRQQP